MNVLDTHGEALFLIAFKYQVAGLIQLCESHFIAQLNEDNVVNLLVLADMVNSVQLKEKTLYFIGDNNIFFFF